MSKKSIARLVFAWSIVGCSGAESEHHELGPIETEFNQSGGGSGLEESTGGVMSGGAAGLASGGSIVEATGGNNGGETASGGALLSSGGRASGGTVNGTGGGAAEGSGGGNGQDQCPRSGSVTYELNNPEAWPSDVVMLITQAMDDAVYYYNCYSDLSKSITVNYNTGVPTAEANVDGWLSFGANKSYMQVATAMHEVSHTLGVGYFPWTELMSDGQWVGPHVDELMNSIPANERDVDEYSQRTYIRGDGQHFWPYGLNQASEHQSEWSLINHVRIVAAMNQDKAAYQNGEL